MQSDFAALIGGQHDYYLAVALIAALCAAALYGVVAAHGAVLVREARRPLRPAAQATGALALVIALGALGLLTGDATPAATGWWIGLVGLGALAVPVGRVAGLVARRRWSARSLPLVLPLVWPGVLGVALLRWAFGLGSADPGFARTLPWLLAAALAGTAVLAWRLAFGLAQQRIVLEVQESEAARDKPLERQLRAMTRELRAANRRAEAPGGPPAERPGRRG